MEKVENKEILCEVCEGMGTVHVTIGWKDYSFNCPNCRHDDFVKGIANVNLSEQVAINLINNFGQAGDE
jgi:excinuclease UvrABC ATPase subunit